MKYLKHVCYKKCARTLGRSLKLDPNHQKCPSIKRTWDLTPRSTRAPFATNACVSPTPCFTLSSGGICVLYRPQGLAFCSGNFNRNRFGALHTTQDQNHRNPDLDNFQVAIYGAGYNRFSQVHFSMGSYGFPFGFSGPISSFQNLPTIPIFANGRPPQLRVSIQCPTALRPHRFRKTNRCLQRSVACPWIGG